MEGGRAHFEILSFNAMGFRAVAHLDDYSLVELIDLLEWVAALIRQRLTFTGSASRAESVASCSVVEPEEPAASSSGQQTSGAAGSSRAPGLKSPFECQYHCKYCFEQCCRPVDAYKNHACLEHRHRR